jgi:hypothetical protein
MYTDVHDSIYQLQKSATDHFSTCHYISFTQFAE